MATKPAKKAAPVKKAGRPSKFTEEIASEICCRIAEGQTLRAICRDEHMPSFVTVYNWIETNEAFSLRIARARDVGYDAIAEDAMAIADTPLIGEEVEIQQGKEKVKRGDMVTHRRLQVETRLKLLAKWSPKKYGDKITQEHTGAGGESLSFQVVFGK